MTALLGGDIGLVEVVLEGGIELVGSFELGGFVVVGGVVELVNGVIVEYCLVLEGSVEFVDGILLGGSIVLKGTVIEVDVAEELRSKIKIISIVILGGSLYPYNK